MYNDLFCKETDNEAFERILGGRARNMRDALPNTSFTGFIGTFNEQNDAHTQTLFGEYVSVCGIQRKERQKDE